MLDQGKKVDRDKRLYYFDDTHHGIAPLLTACFRPSPASSNPSPPPPLLPLYLGPIFLHVNCVKLYVQKLQNVGMAHGLQGRDFGAKLKERAFDSLTYFQKRRERKM